ncbi:MAG: hypothetical protein Unbinned8210contig1002_3 [Prokaryotic dsDNA virus sp.]|nr:MAG: hypothetical protein Unbinned8210contig1002_3 [Prokaryotic dsDNA virus sp.]|tara:strand:+ start:2128 stop:2817 length:690 start_codon:yes stop_codon:yes gene_type:complete
MSITISINKQGKEQDVEIPVDWKDMTIKYFGQLATIISKHHNDAQEEKNEEASQEYDPFSGQKIELDDMQLLSMNQDIFAYVTGLPREEVKLVENHKIAKVLEVMGMLSEEYKYKGVRSFVIEGEEYFFPSEFFKRETFGDYIESTQLDMYIKDMQNGRFDVLPEQMAILCRKKDEVYHEDDIPEKAKKFSNITMDIAWEFAFFLTNQSEKLQKLFPTSFHLNKDEQEA